MESELVALDGTSRDALWLRRLLFRIGLTKTMETVTIKEDNSAVVSAVNTGNITVENRYIEPALFAVRGNVKRKELRVEKVDTEDNVADFFTMPLPMTRFEKLRTELGVVDVSE